MKPKQIVRKLEKELNQLKSNRDYWVSILYYPSNETPNWLKEIDEEIKHKWKLLQVAKIRTKFDKVEIL